MFSYPVYNKHPVKSKVAWIVLNAQKYLRNFKRLKRICPFFSSEALNHLYMSLKLLYNVFFDLTRKKALGACLWMKISRIVYAWKTSSECLLFWRWWHFAKSLFGILPPFSARPSLTLRQTQGFFLSCHTMAPKSRWQLNGLSLF